MLVLPEQFNHPMVQDMVMALYKPLFELFFSCAHVFSNFVQYIADRLGYTFLDNNKATLTTKEDFSNISIEFVK